MHFSTISSVVVASFAATAVAGGPFRGCHPPGDHNCAFIVDVSLTSNGFQGGTAGGTGFLAVDGACNVISTKVNKQPGSGKGFDGTVDLNFGKSVTYHVDYADVGTIDGARITYGDYTNTQCGEWTNNHGLEAGRIAQCNFPC